STDECSGLLQPLGFRTELTGEGGPEEGLSVTVPSWRPDCDREADLVEEIARMYGYDKLARALLPRPMSGAALNPYQKGRRQVREVLAAVGATEIWGPSFCAPQDIARVGLRPEDALELENPLDQSQGLLRTSLLPGLLGALRSNR